MILSLWLACSPPASVTPVGHATPVYGGTVVIADEDEYRSMDPAIAYDERSWNAEWLVFDTLVRYDHQQKITPMLATHWEVSPDFTAYTFHLREGVRFHNGRLMTAQDVLYSLNRLFDPALASPAFDFYANIAGAQAVHDGQATAASGLTAPDDHTVVIQLTTPDPLFLNMMALLFAAPIPKEEVEARGKEWEWSPVGTGPFKVAEWRLGEETRFVANRDYWDPSLPYVDEIQHLPNYPASVQFLKLEAGELHEIDRATAPDYLWLKKDPVWQAQVQEAPEISTYGEMMNTELPPFDNVWFRRAVSAAIDREKLKKIRNGRLFPTASWVPPALGGYDVSSPYQQYDPAKAKEYLAKAGYPNGYPDTIRYMTVTGEGGALTALSIQQDLAEIGVKIEIQNVTFPVYLTSTQRRKTVAFAYTAWSMDFPHASNFLETKFRCDRIAEENSVNDAFYCNPAVDKLLDEARVTPDPEAQAALYRQAQRMILDDAPYAVEYHPLGVYITHPVLKGFVADPIYTRDLRAAWLDLPTTATTGRASP